MRTLAAFLLFLQCMTLASGVFAAAPIWTVEDQNLFQDSFPGDGTLTGTVRADIARDIRGNANMVIQPGDSVAFFVADAVDGIANGEVYIYVLVRPIGQANKSGAGLVDNAIRWPHVGNVVVAGKTWTKIRCDATVPAVAGMYCVDLHDTRFTPPDTVEFFFSAKSADAAGTTGYLANPGTAVATIEAAAASPFEFTCLPTDGPDHFVDLLYVHSAGSSEAVTLWATALESIGVWNQYDRYDVRAAAVPGVNNRLASRVKNIEEQLSKVYDHIVWDCGDLSATLGDGSGALQKTDDYALVNTYLDKLDSHGGVYLCGADVFETLNGSASASATALKAFIPFTLVTGDHKTLACPPSPVGCTNRIAKSSAGHLCFGTDTFKICASCATNNDFDVVTKAGTTVGEVHYVPPDDATKAAVLSNKKVNSKGKDSRLIMSGISLQYVTDDEHNGVVDRSYHLYLALTWLWRVVNQPIGATALGPADQLFQNFPNPFNPRTTISFAMARPGRARLAIYTVSGELVRSLEGGILPAGSHRREWDGRNTAGKAVSSGVYFYRLETGTSSLTKKMLMLK